MLIKKTHLLALTILLFQHLCCFGADYSLIETLGAACEGRDSCTNLTQPNDFFGRNCECDSRCGTFGDCCIDAKAVKPYRNRLLSCMPYGTTPYLGAYVVSGCPLWSSFYSNCLSTDKSDPLVAAPVSTPNGPTYHNAHCAACNGADLAVLVPWTPLVNCETLAHYNLSAGFVWSNLKRDGGEWGVRFRDQFHVCTVLYDKPDTVRNVRLCRAEVVSTCPDVWESTDAWRHCESYTAVVHTTHRAYRNPHCALCNGVKVEELYCDREEIMSGRLKFSFALLFDVNTSDGDRVGISEKGSCPKDQKYDPFFDECRNLVCALPGYRKQGKKCVKVASSSS